MAGYLKNTIALLFASLSFYSASATIHHVYVGQGGYECFPLGAGTLSTNLGDTIRVHWVSGTHDINGSENEVLSAANPTIDHVVNCDDVQGAGGFYCQNHGGSCYFEAQANSQPGVVTITGPDTVVVCIENANTAYLAGVTTLHSTHASGSGIAIYNEWLMDGEYVAETPDLEDENGSTLHLESIIDEGVHYFYAVNYNDCGGIDTSNTVVAIGYCYPAAGVIEAVQTGYSFQFECTDCCNVTSYTWDYGDGSPNTTGYFGNHTYTSPGEYTVYLFTTGLGGCDAGGVYDVSLPTGIPSLRQDSYQLSPSPASTQINIRAAKPLASVRLYDIAGRLVQEQIFGAGLNTQVGLPVQDIPNGMYQLQIRFSDGAASSRKLEINH